MIADSRGSMHSEGDILWWGRRASIDVRDTIDWVGTQPWCNGRVGMSGNSQLAIMQWFAAAEQPKHLAAIAPWEGLTDMYRDNMAQGGIPTPEFLRNEVAVRNYGHGEMEDPAAMIERYPLLNAYWQDKRVQLDRVQVPAYVVASYSNTLHSRGTLVGFKGISSQDKWLRVHASMEWPDLYHPENLEDLCRFFDHYLKGAKNGWEATPRVRYSLLDPSGSDELNRIDTQWPPTPLTPKVYFLDAGTQSLQETPGAAASLNYDPSVEMAGPVFRLSVDHPMEIAGPIRLRLWVEAQGAEDMDLFAQVYKEDPSGAKAYHICVPGRAAQAIAEMVAAGRAPALMSYAGPQGRLRVSHRALDEALSTPMEPVHSHQEVQPLSPGEVVPVDLAIWPVAMKVNPGETLCLAIGGRPFDTFALPGTPGSAGVKTCNRGFHILHTGGTRDSQVILPLLPLD